MSPHPSRRAFLSFAASATIQARFARVAFAQDPLGPGDHAFKLHHGGSDRACLVHIPPRAAPACGFPVLLALHPIASDARFMVRFSNLNPTSDRHGFVAAYPDGSGLTRARSWNAGGVGNLAADDVGFIDRLIDHLAAHLPIDPSRVHATGMSNGGMMCYRLASELSHRIASIAPVSGPMAIPEIAARRPVSVLHFHGTADRIVPLDGPSSATPGFIRFLSVADTIRRWAEFNGCPAEPAIERHVAEPPGLPVRITRHAPGRAGSEVVLHTIEGAGHVWPGVTASGRLLGPGAPNVPAGELIAAFIARHSISSIVPSPPPIQEPVDPCP